MDPRKPSVARRTSAAILLLLLPGLGLGEVAAAVCPASIREIDFAAFLARRHVPDPAECIFTPGADGPVELQSVEFADLDGRPGEEAVIRAQTCFMNSGGADISAVLALQCDAPSGSLVELPVDVDPGEGDPGRPRAAPWLAVEGTALVSTVALFHSESSNQQPGWEKTVVYTFDGARFVVASTKIRPL